MDVTSTPLRKSKKKQMDLLQQTPINRIQEDEVERRNRRSLVSIQKQMSSISSQESPNLNSSVNASVDLEVAKGHLKLCQKLFAENKINSKNAWHLKLIDYFHLFVSQDVFGKDLMTIAAMSVEICTRVYACRVDDLYEKGLQLASSIMNAEKQRAREDEEVDADEAEGENIQSKRKKKSKKLSASQKHMIAKDPKSLEQSNLPKLQSMFFMGHVDINASNNENLLTNKLPMDHIGYKMMLLDKVNQGMLHYGEEDKVAEQDHVTTLKLQSGPFKICRAFTGFHIDEWDLEQEEAQMAEIDKVQNTAGPVNDELVYDEQGIPIAELDESIHDIFADEQANDDVLEEAEDQVNHLAPANQEAEFISSFCPSDSNHFTNNDPWWMKRVWIGPSHWKNKFIKQRAHRFTGKIINQAPPKTKRKLNNIAVDISFSDDIYIDMTKKLHSSKKVKYDIDKFTLPLNYLPFVPDSCKLLVTPFVYQKKSQPKADDEEYEHSPYDYNNPNDSQYCSQHSINEELEGNNEPLQDDLEHERIEGANCEGDMTTYMLANLVEAPEMVQKIYISYALHAKKMDMKRLKNTMWEVLTETKGLKTVVNIEEKAAKKMAFSRLYQTLPSRLPPSMKAELSTHLAFVALLHLTNQYNLKLTGQADLHDLRIEQDK